LVCVISTSLCYAPSECINEEGYIKEVLNDSTYKRKYIVAFPIAICGYNDWIFDEDELYESTLIPQDSNRYLCSVNVEPKGRGRRKKEY